MTGVPRISSGSGWWGSPRHPMFLKYKSQWRVLVPEALSVVGAVILVYRRDKDPAPVRLGAVVAEYDHNGKAYNIHNFTNMTGKEG